jgi:hypothetical protein
MLTYATVMFFAGAALSRFAFVSPNNRKGLENGLFVYGVCGVLGTAVYVIYFSGTDPWSPWFVIESLIAAVSSFLPYLGYRLGDYFGYRYEGK